jgi:hypothetical protein
LSQTIFFSWQSDRSTKVCRNFIENALNDAIRRIAADASVDKAPRDDLAVDRDTQNVPGSPPIFDTILSKIEKAIIFVPDITFVGSRVGGRPVPNPNVLIEYGYALKQHGHSHFVPVMNTAYGEPSLESMPFNLGHRKFPIQYNLPEDATEDTRKVIRATLSKELASAIRLIIENEDLSAVPQPQLIERPHNVIDEADDYANEVDFQYELNGLGSGAGLEKVRANVRELFAELAKSCAEINDRGRLHIEFEGKPWGEREVDNFCWIRTKPFAMQVDWHQPYAGTDRDAALLVAAFKGPIILPSEIGRLMAFDQPQKLSTKAYTPYLSRKYEIGWAEKQSNIDGASFISNKKLVDACLADFIKLLKSDAGRDRAPERHVRSQRPSRSPWI